MQGALDARVGVRITAGFLFDCSVEVGETRLDALGKIMRSCLGFSVFFEHTKGRELYLRCFVHVIHETAELCLLLHAIATSCRRARQRNTVQWFTVACGGHSPVDVMMDA
jgi:hypothetical protein